MADDSHSALSPGLIVRMQYASYLFVGLFSTLILRGSVGRAFSRFFFLEKGCAAVTGSSCTGEMVAYRVSFSLAIFFFLHWLSVSDLTCCINGATRAELQARFFTVKSVLLVGINVCVFFIPNGFFFYYAYACMFASAIFLLLNIIFLVDFSYYWNDDWGERADRNSKWMWYLLSVSSGSFLLGIGITIVSFMVFVPHQDCNFNAFLITSVLFGALVYTVLSIRLPHGSIVPSSIVFLYTCSILFTTMRTQDSEYCNRWSSGAGTFSIKQMLLGILVPSFTLFYAVVSAGASGSSLTVQDDEDEVQDDDPDTTGHLSHYLYFYFIMILGSMYLAMLATGWRVNGGGDESFAESTKVGAGVRYVTILMAIILYIWTLIAPYTCCKDRDYGFDVEDEW